MVRTPGACMAAILAACVAAAAAGAPSEEWVERLRLLEARLEQSEQREAALHKRVAFLEGEVQRLRPSREEAEPTAPKVRTSKAAVGSMGEPEAVGRRLSSAPTCCRWTADDTCGSVPAERFEVCTHMHEYLEGKTTTHEFADLDTCLGPDASKWSAKFDGAMANVTLSYDAAVMATLKTPLKVTHAADCGNVPPTLTVQMDTAMSGTLKDRTGAEITAKAAAIDEVVSAADPQPGSFSPQGLTLVDFGYGQPLDKTITLTSERTVLASYQIPTHLVNYLVCHLYVTTDGGTAVEKVAARSIHGNSRSEYNFMTNSGLWWGNLPAGTHQFRVLCRTDAGVNMWQYAGLDYLGNSMQVLVL